jgi:glycosyltransferase involved in cell wall biosynthesis
MSVLMVSTFPPERCGVASYAAQSVRALRDAGETVRVLTWGAGKGDIHLPAPPLGRRVAALIPHCRTSGRAILHYMPSFYTGSGSRLDEVLARVWMTRLFQSVPNLDVIVHEQSWYPRVEELSVPGRLLWALERRQWAAARNLRFHNQAAIDTHCQRFRLSGGNATVVTHGRDFRPNYTGGRQEARRELQLGTGELTFASVGFITPYKGYELALEGLAAAPDLCCRYFIVGSIHPKNDPRDQEYLAQLRRLAGGDPRVEFRDEFVDDVAFDRWITAADAVLLPYRSSTTSSVLARCHLLGTPAVTTRAAGLDAELHPGDVAVDSPAEFAAALRRWREPQAVISGRGL